MKAHDAARAAMAQSRETRAWFTTDEINAWAEKKLKENPQWTSDWDTQAVLVEEMQRMAKRIEDLETEQDCVGWFGYDTGLRLWFETNKGDDDAIPLYKDLQKRSWAGLTDDEIKEIVGPYGDTPIKGYTRKLFDQIEAALRSKNT